MKLRYFFAACVFVMLLSLTACSEKTKALQLTEFQSEVTIKNSENEIRGSFCFSSASDMTFTVSYPEEMEKMTLYSDGTELKLTSGKVSVPFEKLSFGENMFSPLFDAVSLLSVSSPMISEEGTDNLVLQGESGEYSFVVSSDEMRIASIEKNGITYSFRYQ
ncbi:MAG: hypothetical protein IJ491_04905 [Clostridia bacterium]|nr:hypothetical protein [Clostridia bacterium]